MPYRHPTCRTPGGAHQLQAAHGGGGADASGAASIAGMALESLLLLLCSALGVGDTGWAAAAAAAARAAGEHPGGDPQHQHQEQYPAAAAASCSPAEGLQWLLGALGQALMEPTAQRWVGKTLRTASCLAITRTAVRQALRPPMPR